MSYGLVPTITIKILTRVSRTSAELLDNIFSNVTFRSRGVNVESDLFGVYAEFEVFTHIRLNSDFFQKSLPPPIDVSIHLKRITVYELRDTIYAMKIVRLVVT